MNADEYNKSTWDLFIRLAEDVTGIKSINDITEEASKLGKLYENLSESSNIGKRYVNKQSKSKVDENEEPSHFYYTQ